MKKILEEGAAHMFIELKKGYITVYHGKGKEVLFKKHAKKGDWNKIWRAIK